MEASILLFQLATPCSEFQLSGVNGTHQKVGTFLGTNTSLVPAKGSSSPTSSQNCDVAVCVSGLDLHHISLCNAAVFLCSQPAFAMTSLCTLQASTLSSPPPSHPSLPLISPCSSPLFCSPFFFFLTLPFRCTPPPPLWPSLSLWILPGAITASCQLARRWTAYHLSAGAIIITDTAAGFPVASALIPRYLGYISSTFMLERRVSFTCELKAFLFPCLCVCVCVRTPRV